MAAAYLFHICSNHPFMDGNKRAAFAASIAFLHVNGFVLEASDASAEDLVLSVARGELQKSAVSDFFKQNIRPRT